MTTWHWGQKQDGDSLWCMCTRTRLQKTAVVVVLLLFIVLVVVDVIGHSCFIFSCILCCLASRRQRRVRSVSFDVDRPHPYENEGKDAGIRGRRKGDDGATESMVEGQSAREEMILSSRKSRFENPNLFETDSKRNR